MNSRLSPRFYTNLNLIGLMMQFYIYDHMANTKKHRTLGVKTIAPG